MMTKAKMRVRGKGDTVGELKNQLARALADYDNIRKRTEVEREVWEKYTSGKLLVRFLPVLDNLESAQIHLKDGGLAIAIEEFKKVLREEGLEEIKPESGENFDTKIHEAVESISGGKKGQVAEVVTVGWRYCNGPVLRFAKIKVFGGK